jgi:hypothetical protein
MDSSNKNTTIIFCIVILCIFIIMLPIALLKRKRRKRPDLYPLSYPPQDETYPLSYPPQDETCTIVTIFGSLEGSPEGSVMGEEYVGVNKNIHKSTMEKIK